MFPLPRPVALLPVLLALLPLPRAGASDLLIDFNSTNQDNGPTLQEGYQPYNAGHEQTADFLPARSYDAFGTSVTLQVIWPNTTSSRVRQMIDRGTSYDLNWTGQKLDLLTDWIGTDTRTAENGNGNYDGENGTPTPIEFRFSGLPAGPYNYRSYHHDTENVHTAFKVEISTDGGSSFTSLEGPFRITDSTTGGNPASAQVFTGSANQDPATLPSTVETGLSAQQGQDFVVRYTPLSDSAGVHLQIMAINGFELRATTPITAPTDIQLSNEIISTTAVEGTVVGHFTTTDPTPDDTFTYLLAEGNGSEGNANFIIQENSLVIDRQLAEYQTGNVVAVRVRSTDAAGAWTEKQFELLVVNDSDRDGLDDEWELLHFGNLSQGPGDDSDGDGLTHAEEYAAGTNPATPDTDNDGLRDNDEINVYFTSPLDLDSDSDGLSDGDEVHLHGTSPLLADSDEDGYDDATELAEDTNPNDAQDFPNLLLPLQISEFLASNATGLRDGWASREDWIEIHNPNREAVNLTDYRLTDTVQDLAKWIFPHVEISAGGYVVVFASGADGVDFEGHLHTNFRLSAAGEFLALVRPDGQIEDQFAPLFPPQFSDVSYGRHANDDSLRYFSPATPGSANGSGYEGVVEAPVFSVGRGFYDVPFELSLSSATPESEIRYTVDGSKPTTSSGAIYQNEALPIATTSRVRAISYRPGWLSQPPATHSYVFLDHIAQQPADPPGWPSDWGYSADAGTVVPSDYEMDPRVVNHTLPGYGIREALSDIPSISINMPMEDFINPPGGIYASPLNRAEKECSIEYLLPDGAPGFQTDCKIEIHGNASRRPARMQKHSLRLSFSSEVGPTKLRYPLFPNSPVSSFNKLVLRACFTDSWGLVSWADSRYRPNDSQYLRDVWMKRSFGDMGHPTSHGRFVHLYVNGLYFGLHDLTDRLEEDFFAEHLGGEPEHWQVNKDFTTGSPRWSEMMSLATSESISTAAGYESIQRYLDLENFADYMLLHFYADAEDWPHKNGYAAANPVSGDGKFRFFVWDQEIALDKFSWNRYSTNPGSNSPGRLFQRLRLNPEFRLLFADRVRKHFFNGGAISLEGSANRYLALASTIDKAIVAESARWGDVQAKTPYGNSVQQPSPLTNRDHDAYPPAPHAGDPGGIYFTREDSWVVERDNIVNHHLPIIHSTTDGRGLIQELRANDLYPPHEPPIFSQHGGVLASRESVAITAPLGAIHFTTDGSDPRNAATGTPGTGSTLYTSPVEISADVTLKARALLSDGTWSALTAADFQLEPSIPEFLPGGDERWNVDANWTHAPFPDGVNARARVLAPAAGDRDIELGKAITVGEVTFDQDDSPFRNGIGSQNINYPFRFESSEGPAILRVNGSGSGWTEVEVASVVFLASPLTVEVNHAVGSSEFGALRLRSQWTGPGGLTKTGAGRASLTGSGKLYSGPTLIAEGVLQVSQPASMSESSAITVQPGAQLRLVSAGAPTAPRIHRFGGPLQLSGNGTPADGTGLGSLGALRYDPGTGENLAIITNPLEFRADSGIHIEGMGNLLDLTGPISGEAGWTKSGGGSLKLSAESMTYRAPVTVVNGTLDLAGRLGSPIHISSPAKLRGFGSSGALTGNGVLQLNAGLLYAPSVAGLHGRFELGGENSGTLATDSLPDPLASLHLYLAADPAPQPTDRLQGGIILPPGSNWERVLIDSSPKIFLPDLGGSHAYDGRNWTLLEDARLTRAAIVTDLGSGPVAREILEIRFDGIPLHYSDWQTANFSPAELQDPAISGERATPFRDNIPNLLRYALGVPSGGSAEARLPRLVHHETAAAFRFPYDPALFDLIYRVEVSTDLSDWSAAPFLFDSSISNQLPDADGWIEVEDPAPLAGPRFYRLRVSRITSGAE